MPAWPVPWAVGSAPTDSGGPVTGALARCIESWTERLTAQPAADTPSLPARPRRLSLRIWEVPEKLLCPIIGTCLPLAEVRRLTRKHELVSATASNYEAHVALISHCKRRNPVAQDVQRTLDKRHVAWLGRFERVRDETEALALWRSALDSGEAAGALWGVVSGRAATPELLQAVYEDIHMFSHQMGAGARADLRRLERLQTRVRELEADMARLRTEQQAKLAERDARIAALQARADRLTSLEEENLRLRERLSGLESAERIRCLEQELAQTAAERDRLRERLRSLKQQVRALEGVASRLRTALRLAEDERDALERFYMDATTCTGCEDSGGCALLTGRRLLCVGGRAGLQAQYRALVRRLGAELIIHDGGREEALNRLPDLLSQADAVLCPTDCVSHAAYYQVKRFCKQYDKPCVMLRASSLASFAEGLRRLGEGRHDLGPIWAALATPRETDT